MSRSGPAGKPACSRQPTPDPSSWRPVLLVAGLILVALNLRPALASLAPVLPEAMRDMGIDAGLASLLTMAPVLCLGLFGFFAPRLADRFGNERTVAGALLLLAAGTALRGVAAFSTLLAGMLASGAAIGVAGVLLPGLVKRDFPKQASLMTGVYTMSLSAGAAAAAGLTVPLSHWLGDWPEALAFWALPALAAILLWLPQIPRKRAAATVATAAPDRIRGLWRDPLAWQVTLYMGLQSSLAYTVFGWLAPILRDRGLDPVMAGFAVSVTVLVQLITALTAPMIAARRPTQGGVAAALALLVLTGLLGCLHAPLETIWLWIVLLGLGQGGCFSVALALIVFRAPDARVAAHLSGMAQSVGYTLASAGPLLTGLLHDWLGNWSATGVLAAVITALAVAAGLGAGRARHVRVALQPH